MSMRLAHAPATGTAAELRALADEARGRLAKLTLWFPIAGSAIIVADVMMLFLLGDELPAPAVIASAFVLMWGLYGPYLIAITAYLWTQARTRTASERAPNGWQMAILAHRFTVQIIIVTYTVPLLIYLMGALSLEAANDAMGFYQSAVHTATAAAITYFFARPEEGPAPKPL